MSNFRGVLRLDEVRFDNTWKEATRFKSKDSLVNSKGKVFETSYQGQKFRLVSKKERKFTAIERISRVALGLLAVVCSVGIALSSKSIRQLFTKDKETVRIGLLQAPEKQPDSDLPRTSSKKKELTNDAGDHIVETETISESVSPTSTSRSISTTYTRVNQSNIDHLQEVIAGIQKENEEVRRKDEFFSAIRGNKSETVDDEFFIEYRDDMGPYEWEELSSQKIISLLNNDKFEVTEYILHSMLPRDKERSISEIIQNLSIPAIIRLLPIFDDYHCWNLSNAQVVSILENENLQISENLLTNLLKEQGNRWWEECKDREIQISPERIQELSQKFPGCHLEHLG